MDKYKASRNMGFITGPLMIALGLFSYMKANAIPALSITMVVLGCIRLGLTIYTMNKPGRQDPV